MTRGDVWWTTLPGRAGQRPVVLVSRESVYGSRSSVTVAPATTRIRGIRVEVPLGPEDGMPRGSVVNVDDLVTISQDSLEEFITHLGRNKIRAINAAIRYALGLEDWRTCDADTFYDSTRYLHYPKTFRRIGDLPCPLS